MNCQGSPLPKVLVLGAYGLIGKEVALSFLNRGFEVTGLGRDARLGQRVLPDIPWIGRDLRDLCDEPSWRDILSGISCVVNCSGALQGGPKDDLDAVHHHAIAALAAACKSEDIALVQISAVGAHPEAAPPFLASKGRGDHAIQREGGRFHILRPGLVIAQNAYGGTTMLRMLAAFPILQPIALPEAKIQTISLGYVAEVVVAAAKGDLPEGRVIDLVEDRPHSLRSVVAELRRWLGFPSAKREIVLPEAVVHIVSKGADLFGRLGWRSPLRTTSLQVLSEGVLGSPTDLRHFGLHKAPALQQTLRDLQVGPQDRLAARMALLLPMIIAVLCLFWSASGIIGLARITVAANVLTDVGWPASLAVASVAFWAVIDIAIGVAFSLRAYASRACLAAVGVSLFYILAATATVPYLWLDPLGPLVKVVPSLPLALVARAGLETR